MRPPDDLAEALAVLGPDTFAGPLLWFPQIGSTNDAASRLADEGSADGTIVVADEQTAGRGRHGRVWVSPPGAGLYVSVILRPRGGFASLTTLAAGVALAEAIEMVTGLGPVLKWPNDIYAGGRKLAGILAEAGGTIAAPHIVLGFGINILPAAFPREVAHRATSLEGELGRGVERGPLLAECLVALARRRRELEGGAAGVLLAAWRRRAAPLLGRAVEWDHDGTTLRGRAHDVDDSGALLVTTPAGTVRVMSGEVRWT